MGGPSAPSNAVGGRRRSRLAGVLPVGLGVFTALAAMGLLARSTGDAWLLGSFGATGVLLFGFPQSPFSRARNVIGGHLISSAIGLLFLHLMGPGWIGLAAAGACAAMLMLLTESVHPPAGSNPVIVFMTQPGWDFLLLPTLAGACTLFAIAAVYRRAMSWERDH